MHFFVYLVFSVLLVCLQTTVLPVFPKFFAQFDLLVPFDRFSHTVQIQRAGIMPVILIAGSLMDLLSGGSGGVYIITYLMIFAGFRNTPGYFHFKNQVLFQIVLLLAVLLENVVFNLVLSFQTQAVHLSFNAGRVLAVALFWALIGGPFFYGLFNVVFNEVDQLITGGAEGENIEMLLFSASIGLSNFHQVEHQFHKQGLID